MIGIYKITNKINGDAYIGQSTQIEERFIEHKNPTNWARESNKSLYKAFIQFGLQNFDFSVSIVLTFSNSFQFSAPLILGIPLSPTLRPAF